VKKLIKLGVNLNIKDNQNRIPIDIARLNNNLNIIEILEHSNVWNICNFNQHRAKDNFLYNFLFIFFFSSLEIILFISVFPNLSIINLKISFVLFLLLMISYIIICYSNPGFKKTKSNKSFKSLLDYGARLNDICPYCVETKDNKSRYCYNCKSCVEYYNHHCVWISNCVGRKNFNCFILFLILCLSKLVYNVINCYQSNYFFLL
jgi:hypothetical protein